MLVVFFFFFLKKCDPFFRIKVFMQEGSPSKNAFSIERHYNVGSKMMQN